MKAKIKTNKKHSEIHTHIAVVLDRSGSMESMRKEIIGGFNGFLKDQQSEPGEASMTVVQFDNEIDRLADFKNIKEISPLTEQTYVPRGCTRLYDAIGLTVNTVKDKIAALLKKPEKVLVVILTDGMENASQEYQTEGIKSLLEAQQNAGWQFTFIGANQDAILSARGIGLNNAASNLTYAATPKGAVNMMASLSRATSSFRCAPQGATFCYQKSDREAQESDPKSAASYSSKAAFTENSHIAGTAGGNARAAALSPRQRSSIASTAAKARWSKHSV